MIAGIPALEVLGVRLTVERVDTGLSTTTTRCEIEGHRLQAVTCLAVSAVSAAALLDQVERQYQDFERRVSWASDSGPSELELTWTLNRNGHAQGRYALKSPQWRVEGELDGDQSYLPKVALGLRLMLRAMNGEAL